MADVEGSHLALVGAMSICPVLHQTLGYVHCNVGITNNTSIHYDITSTIIVPYPHLEAIWRGVSPISFAEFTFTTVAAGL